MKFFLEPAQFLLILFSHHQFIVYHTVAAIVDHTCIFIYLLLSVVEKMGKLIVYVGTYSEVLGHVPYGKGRGIELFEFDTETGALSPLKAQVLYSY